VLVTRARGVEKVLGHDPGPCRYRGRRDSAREHSWHAVGLSREERQELHFERVIRWDALQRERTLDPILRKTNPFDLHERVLRDELAPNVADLGAKAPHLDRRRAAPLGLLQSKNQRVVLGYVVGCVTEWTRQLGHELPLLVVEHGPRARWSGVAARGPVRIHDESHAPKICAIRARSTLPPDTIETTRSPGRTGIFPARSAPVAAAPAGSATSFARCARKRIPSAIRSSSITTTSATRRRMISSGMLPAIGAASPSAIVSMRSRRTGWPASSARRIPAAPVGSTPMIRARGRLAATAVAMPAISPPPPTPTTNRSASGRSSRTSSAHVPWPAIIAASS